VALETLIHEMADILKREIRSFNIVQELLILEEKSLVECNIADLKEVVERQEDVFSSIACLEKSRIVLLEKIAKETGDDPDSLTVSVLADKVDGSTRKDLVEAGHILGKLHEDIQRRKSTNTMLINQSIMLVESDIRIILNAANSRRLEKSGYSSKAESSGPSKSVCLDTRL